MIQSPTSNVPFLDLLRENWLSVRTHKLAKRTGLIVIKSVWLRDTAPMLEEVRSFIDNYGFELQWKGRFLNGMLMFGEGELSIYLTPADSDKDLDVEIDPALIEELRAQGLRIVNEMTEGAAS